MIRHLLMQMLFCLMLAISAAAVEPDEILKDQGLEQRARNISAGLRCLVCQNQSIDESDAGVARDLRLLIREQLQQKKSDDEVVDFVVARYGEYVLLQPRFQISTLLLWLTPFALLLAALVYALVRPKVAQPPDALSATEKAELDLLLKD